ncbi:ABC transporter permease [Saccharopolyspora sp. K220]|uniref:ABC transporter permease n=1 Tax=Saccharopolyspora soli TaxID=2926618 RepID=UPI001F55EC31|nr:ABC transporter permease [Saccharopolyspora soli]MCI2422742.1 ABC transporter permease [Saccharopolyspora soli]
MSVPTAQDTAAVREYVAPQWKLIWWRFRKHRLAMISSAIMLLFALVAIFAEVIAPQSADTVDERYTYLPPQQLHLIDTSGGELDFGLYVHGYDTEVDPYTLERSTVVDTSAKIPVGLFVKGEPYELWGLIPADVHLIGPKNPEQPMYLLGADRLGRDMLSRIVHGARVSLSIGLTGVALTFALGVLLGGISGYFGGAVDTVIQRIIELLMSIPTIPLWLGLSAALPADWGPLQTYFAISVILALIGWTDLSRVVRSRFLALREEDFVRAAVLDGCSRLRIIFRHMLPSFTSHIIASLTLAIPLMILAETALSFLGLGLQAPVVSWGVLMQEAQSIVAVATAPWVLTPGIAVAIAVLALNFVGDGLRDSADPYSR